MENENKILKVVKGVKNIATDIGCVNIVSNVVTTVMPPGVGVISRICMKVASWCLGSAAADYANEKTDKIVDKVADAIKEGDPMKILVD